MLLQIWCQELASGAIVRSFSHFCCGIAMVLSDCRIMDCIFDCNFLVLFKLISFDTKGGRLSWIFLISYVFWIRDFIWEYSRYCVLLMPNSWTRWLNGAIWLSLKMCCKWVMPFSAHVWKYIDFLFISKSGLFHMGVKLEGDSKELVIWWNFHQAVRAEDIVKNLKHGWHLMDLLMKGRSRIEMLLQTVCSMSSHVVMSGMGPFKYVL